MKLTRHGTMIADELQAAGKQLSAAARALRRGDTHAYLDASLRARIHYETASRLQAYKKPSGGKRRLFAPKVAR